jgi:hypothetical protein
VHPELLVKALAAMHGSATLEEFHAASGITSRSVAKGVLDFVLAQQIGSVRKGIVEFSGRDRLELAAIALGTGCDMEQVSQHLSWKDFESLASEVLSSLGYSTQTNVRFTKPRMEIDVVGVDSDFALALDCKHWKRNNLSSISSFCAKQATRTQELLKRELSISRAVPAVMTLHAERVRFAAGVPIIPVLQLRSFVMDVKGFLDQVLVIERGPA